MNNRNNYKPGLNSKGLPSKRYADEPSKTERGKRRNRDKKHVHEFARRVPSYPGGHRDELEAMYYCTVRKTGRWSKGKICGCKRRRLG